MRLTWRDAIATLLVAAIVVTYGFYLAWGGISLVTNAAGETTLGILDPTGMAGVAIIVGVIAAVVGGWIALGASMALRYLTIGLAAVSALLGVLALAGENIFNNAVMWESVLGAFIASIVALWAVATARHLGLLRGGAPSARTGATPA